MINNEKQERRKENLMIPYSMIGVVMSIVIQTMGAIWWASGVNVKLDYIQKTQVDFAQTIYEGTKNRYTSLDAFKDWTENNKRIDTIEKDLKELGIKVISFQAKYNK